MFFACIFVPDFVVEAILRSEPELRSQVVAVLDGKALMQRVIGQNESAGRAGVEPGMTKLELEACGNIVLRCRSPLQEAAAHAALLDCAQSFSPRVEDVGCDTIVIDLAGLEPLFGPLSKIARDLARRVSDMGLESNVAVAANPDSAMLAARGFAGVTLIPPGKEVGQLGGLPVEVLFAGLSSRKHLEQDAEKTISHQKPTAAAKTPDERAGIASLKRCATQNQKLNLSHNGNELGDGNQLDYRATGKGTTSSRATKAVPSILGAVEGRAPSKPASGFTECLPLMPGKGAPQVGAFSLYEFKEAEEVLDTLNRWGVRNLRSLAALPEVALSERLGQRGLRLQKLARGATMRTLITVEPVLVFEEAIELEHPLVLLEPLAFLLARLLEQLCARLSARALATQELRLRLELDSSCHEESTEQRVGTFSNSAEAGKHSFERTLRLPVPLLDAKIFLKLLQLDLNAHPPGAPILKIHLRAEPVRPRAAQGGLFLPPSPEPEKLELTLARIAGIVGEDKIGSLALLDTYRAGGFRMQRFAPTSQEISTPGTTQGSVTALRIFRPAVPVVVTLRAGCPAHIVAQKRHDIQGEILWSAGPWRSSGDWWEQESWSRDEWDVAVQGEVEITLYRLVRDLLAGRWFLEGVYD